MEGVVICTLVYTSLSFTVPLERDKLLMAPQAKKEDVTQQECSTLQFANSAFHVVAIAASAGGLRAISEILSTLPADFPAAVLIVQHLSPDYRSYLAENLSRCTVLRVKSVEVGELLHPRTVYIAVPGKHLLVNLDDTLSFSDTAKVNFARPSADVLFKSMAASCKTRAIAVILTGRDGDGAGGVEAIKQQGGIVVAQNEVTSECFSMPKTAIETGCVDFILPLDAIAATLVSLVHTRSSSITKPVLGTETVR